MFILYKQDLIYSLKQSDTYIRIQQYTENTSAVPLTTPHPLSMTKMERK